MGFGLALIISLAACTSPRHTARLGDVLEHELGRTDKTIAGYRCTLGAHRGASVVHRENTLAALMTADRDPSYAFIEFDVQYTRDNQIVVFHDLTVLRLYGKVRSIGNETYKDLVELTDGEIATYAEVIDVLTKKLNIEIKSQGDPLEDQRLADEVIADLRARRRSREVMISSISSDVIAYIKEAHPDIKTGQIHWLTSSTYLHLDVLTELLYKKLLTTQADYLMLHVANLRNLESLLELKPDDTTIMFWDFDDRMYLVHKDPGDRLWGRGLVSDELRVMRQRGAR